MRYYYPQLLKIVSVFLIIYGAYCTLSSFVLVFLAASTGTVANFLGQTLAPAENLFMILSMILLVCQSLLLLCSGIVGLRCHDNPHEISECVYLGVAMLLLQLVYIVLDLRSTTNMDITLLLFSVAVPLLYYWAAYTKRRALLSDK